MSFAATGLFKKALDLRAAMTSNSGTGGGKENIMNNEK